MEKQPGDDEKPFLVSVSLFPPCVIILEDISDALGIKSLILKVHLGMRRRSKNTDP